MTDTPCQCPRCRVGREVKEAVETRNVEELIRLVKMLDEGMFEAEEELDLERGARKKCQDILYPKTVRQ